MPTKIEWAEEVWNPITGCTKVSAGCQNCYAERMAKRLRGRFGYPQDDPFKVTFHEEKLLQPLGWKRPKKVFVCSMGDLFHGDSGWPTTDQIFDVMNKANRHTYLILTKRILTAWYYFSSPVYGKPPWSRFYYLKNKIWLGVSVEDQKTADERIPILLQIYAAVRFVSIEPMLGPIDIQKYLGPVFPKACPPEEGITWVIVGGESGPGARPMHPDWVRSIRDQCKEADVPFLFKQWGEWKPSRMYSLKYTPVMLLSNGKYYYKWVEVFKDKNHEEWKIYKKFDPVNMLKVGKKKAGRLLDGKIHDEYPEKEYGYED